MRDYEKVRPVLQGLIGQTVLDITGHDPGDESVKICLMFGDGSMLTIHGEEAIKWTLEGPAIDSIEGS